jgi:hypothetical protein
VQVLSFEGYLVRLHVSHPLFGILVPLVTSEGSMGFEQGRADLEDQMLFALGESMKRLFWAGLAVGHFPREIVVQRVSVRGEVLDDEPGA